jgi:hypothetical protein
MRDPLAGVLGGGAWHSRPGVSLYRLVWTIIGLSVAWRLARYAVDFPLRGDEAFLATSFYVRGFWDMVRPLEYGQIAPLGFMWCQHAVTCLLGLSEPALRFFPLLVGIATVLLFWRFAVGNLGRLTALLAVSIFSASYFPVRYGAELKPYGMDLFVSLALTSLGGAVLARPERARRWIALTAAAAPAVWCSYPSVFVAGGIGLALTHRLVRQPSARFLAGWAAYGVLLVGSFVAMFACCARPHFQAASWLAEIRMWTSAFPPLTEPWRLPLWLLDTHTGELLAYPFGGKHGASALPFLLVLAGCLVLWRRRGEFLFLLLSPLVLTFVAAALHRYPYGGGPRVSLYMAPAFCVLEAIGLGAVLKKWVPRRKLPSALHLAVAVLICTTVVGLGRDLVKPYQSVSDLENRRVVRDLAARSGAGDQWVIFNAITDVAHAPHLGAWGGSAARFRYYVTTLAPVLVQWSPPPATVSPQPGGRTWLLAYRDNKEPFPQERLDQYLAGLQERLGAARRTVFRLDSPEAIEVYEFDR